MSANGGNVHEDSVVHYEPTKRDTVHVELQSPAKNRAKGTTVGHSKRRALVLFERASGSWWNPKFDSPILEKELLHHYFPHTRRRFQYALIYIILACVVWALYFGCSRLTSRWLYFLFADLALGLVAALILVLTRFAVYERLVLPTSLVLAFLLCALLLASFSFEQSDVTLVGTFAGTAEVLLLFYTFIPMPLYVCVPLGLLFSATYEILVAYRYSEMNQASVIVSKALLHLCLHLLGIHIFIVTQVRHRSNFWKVGQCVMARRDLNAEKQNQENMIHSLMPKSVADQVMTSRTDKERDEPDDMGDGRKKRTRSKRAKGEIIFRSFNMNQMENVSILFADIVGFTKMSSNKTAEHLVGLLNDLFGRFDKLCSKAKCEKISTLGDCYYCVAGCPEPQPDHAECCVKMGLGMIKAIRQFDEDNNESVNMRVGVHTGTVLCGIVGTRRFKFDVWSNDVTLANIMESSGRPGMVHISEASYDLLKDKYEVEPGEDVEDLRSFKRLIEHYDAAQSSFTIRHEEDKRVIKTYFITGVKPGTDVIDGDRTTSNSVAITMETPDTGNDTTQEQKDEASRATDVSGNHTEQENSLNGVSRTLLLPGPQVGGLTEGADADKLDEKVAAGKKGKVASSRLASPVHAQKLQNNSSVPVPSIAISVPTSIINITNNIHLTTSVASPPSIMSTNSHRTPSASLSASKSPIAGLHFKGNAITMKNQSDEHMDSLTVPFNETWNKQMMERDKLDQQMIHYLNKDADLIEFFYKPPINRFTLFFNKSRLERDYRHHYFDSQDESLASPRYHSFIEMIISLILFVFISIGCFLVFDKNEVFIILFSVCLLLQVLVLIGIAIDIKFGCFHKIRNQNDEELRDRSWWKLHNFIGIFMAILPAAAAYANLENGLQDFVYLILCFCIIVALLNFCNFSMLCSMMKSGVATVVGVILLILVSTVIYRTPWSNVDSPLCHEIILDILLILVLIWCLNREFEISYRLSFHGSAQADSDTKSMQENKEQADWLLHNIIPAHVSDVVKRTNKYSKNHKDVGVIFATIVNFNEFYDEGFEGGREYLRVLNELVSDYEELLDRKCFKDVEKIKTISSTFMAASGLNEVSRMSNKHTNAHLFALMDFAVELQNVVIRFNESILNFNFVLNIGYNFGEVTAGVIGTTKLLYDIWGDTVNIASRMYSTGEADRIQVPESTLEKLEEMFEFEYRGDIFVKGKGDMKTYLFKSKRPGVQWE